MPQWPTPHPSVGLPAGVFFAGKPTKKPGNKKRQKPTPNLTALHSLVTFLLFLKLKHPLREHYSTFLDILKYWFPSHNQKKLSKFYQPYLFNF